MPVPPPDVSLVPAVGSQADVLVVGLAEASGKSVLIGVPDDVAKTFGKALGRGLDTVVAALGGTTKVGSAVLVAAPGGLRLVVVGLGPIDVTPEQVRRATGVALRQAAGLAGEAPLTVAVSLDAAEPDVIKGIVEGSILGWYSYRRPDADQSPAGIARIQIVSASKKPEARTALSVGSTTATAVNQAREWVNQPPNQLYPASLVDEARALARQAKLGIEVWDDKALERDGYGGILAVGGGSARKPRLVRLSHEPRGARFHLGLVGKGITFDAGGLNLKTAEGMYTMKSDMAGAAAVLAATAAIAELGVRVRVTSYLALAENLPSGTAYRPSDVLTMYGGKTVENGNSDAEGRLVMADAITRCAEDQPDMILDVATLTGACIVALGERVAGLMASDDQTADHVLDAAEAAGELFWQLPIPEETRAKLESKVADVKSTGDKYGGALTAAAFLAQFVPEGLPWAHLDIAGPAFNNAAPYHYVPSGGTGVAVRTLVALAHSLAS